MLTDISYNYDIGVTQSSVVIHEFDYYISDLFLNNDTYLTKITGGYEYTNGVLIIDGQYVWDG